MDVKISKTKLLNILQSRITRIKTIEITDEIFKENKFPKLKSLNYFDYAYKFAMSWIKWTKEETNDIISLNNFFRIDPDNLSDTVAFYYLKIEEDYSHWFEIEEKIKYSINNNYLIDSEITKMTILELREFTESEIIRDFLLDFTFKFKNSIIEYILKENKKLSNIDKGMVVWKSRKRNY